MAAENLAMGYVMRHGFDGGLRAEGWLAIDSISNIALCVKSAASDSGGEEEESRFWTGGAGFEAEQLRRQGRAKQKHEPAIFAGPSFKILSETMTLSETSDPQRNHDEMGRCWLGLQITASLCIHKSGCLHVITYTCVYIMKP